MQSRLLYTHAVRHACCCRHAEDASALEAASLRHSADGSANSAQLDADPDLEAYLKVMIPQSSAFAKTRPLLTHLQIIAADHRCAVDFQQLSCWAHALCLRD